MNMKAITPVERVKVGTSLEKRGFQRDLWLRKK
jgi:hypothetical protein